MSKVKYPKECPNCQRKELVLSIHGGYKVHVYELIKGKIGKEIMYKPTNSYNQIVYCIDCGRDILELGGLGDTNWYPIKEELI